MKSIQTARFLRWWHWLAAMLLAAGLVACGAPHSISERAQASEAASSRASAKAASTLGTQWGEGRASATQSVQATRLYPDRPQALSQLLYSDEASIRQALGRSADRQLNVLLAGGDVEWAVQDGQGQALPIYSTRGAQNYQLAGRHGERYELVYTNRSQRSYEVVATVDGLDVLTGQAGSVQHSGYLLRPGETLRIDGFRKSQNEVAAFRFANKDRAYANHTPAGDARNVGVIGAALFEVRLGEPQPAVRPSRNQGAEPAPAAFPGDPAASYAPPPQYR